MIKAGSNVCFPWQTWMFASGTTVSNLSLAQLNTNMNFCEGGANPPQPTPTLFSNQRLETIN